MRNRLGRTVQRVLKRRLQRLRLVPLLRGPAPPSKLAKLVCVVITLHFGKTLEAVKWIAINRS